MYKKLSLSLFYSALFLLLSACSDDGDSPKLSGTIATGAAGVGTLYITDSTGSEINIVLKPTNEGKYSANVSGMTPPFILRFDESPEDGLVYELYSYSETSNSKANVTQLTTLAMFLANNETDLSTLYTGWKTTPLDSTKMSVAQAKVNANFATRIDAIGLDSKNYNFMTTEFIPDKAGIDKLLEDLTVNISDTNNLTVSFAGDSNFTFNTSIDISNIIVDSDNYDIKCPAGWCLTLAGTFELAGNTQSISSDKYVKTNIPDEEVPNKMVSLALQEAFEKEYSDIGEIRDFEVALTTSTSTKVVGEVSANIYIVISIAGQSKTIDTDVLIIFTYTKAKP